MISGLHHYALEVPDLAVAEGFLQDFGLETGEKDGSLVAMCPGRDQEQVRLEDLVARAKPRGIAVLVDAASEHIEKPSPYLKRGADMVIYSGGKFLRGPQTSGLLLGRKDLIQAAWRNASPHQAFARGMKVSKEDIIGVLAALEVWFEHRDPAEELRRWNADLAKIAAGLPLPGVSTAVIQPKDVVKVPRLRVTWDAAKYGVDGEGLRLRMLDGEPRVMLDDMAVKANSIEIDPFGLQPGEAEQVARAISAALSMPAASMRSRLLSTTRSAQAIWSSNTSSIGSS